MIWQTVLAISGPSTPTYFLSSNTTDFRGTEPNSFHDDLKADIPDGHVVRYIESLSAFVETHVAPTLEKLEGVRKMLQEDGIEGFSLHAWLQRTLPPLLDLRAVMPSLWMLGTGPYSYQQAQIASVGEIRDVSIEDVRRQVTGQMLCRIGATLTLNIQFSEPTGPILGPPIHTSRTNVRVRMLAELSTHLGDPNGLARIPDNERQDVLRHMTGSVISVSPIPVGVA